jgi:hypothetical protein
MTQGMALVETCCRGDGDIEPGFFRVPPFSDHLPLGRSMTSILRVRADEQAPQD